MNKVILVGRLVRDPELRTTTSGLSNVSFSVAVPRNRTNAQGEREADFINCVAWRNIAETISKYFSKGSQIVIEGRIQTRNYTAQDGNKRYVTEVLVDAIEFVGSRNTNTTTADQSNNTSTYSNANVQTDNYGGSFGANNFVTTDLNEDPYASMGNEVSLSDDDLPF